MGCLQTKCTCDVSVGLENVKIARKCLESERAAMEEEKLKMEKEREIMKWKFYAEVAIFGEKKKMHIEQCRESEKSEERMVKERRELVNQQEDVERETTSSKPRKMRFESGKTSTRKTENLAHLTYPHAESGMR